jgi:hypothetical protein
MRKVLNDPYWKAMMSDDDDAWDTVDEPVAGTSTYRDETSTFGDDWHDFIDFNEEGGGENDGDGGKSDGDNGDEEGAMRRQLNQRPLMLVAQAVRLLLRADY